MRVLALEPYYGGSHQAFLDGWRAHSRHDWTLMTLPPNKWKWRMRHAAVTFAAEVRDRVDRGETFDALFCSDMLNLAEFRGLAPLEIRRLPTIIYFHENQLTYPNRHETEFDYHYVFTNMTSALAADHVWFNSAYHRDAFLGELQPFLKRMPDHHPLAEIEMIRAKSSIQPPGTHPMPSRGERKSGPLRICWAARWEHDKNPETFFQAVRRLADADVEFRLDVVGEQFRDRPEVFDAARTALTDRIDRWGYQPTREAYVQTLLDADVFVSTAVHEFFGISVVEAMSAGAYPLLPWRLAYPELIPASEVSDAGAFFYDGTERQLADILRELAERLNTGDLWPRDRKGLVDLAARYVWVTRASAMDDALEKLSG